MNRRLPLTVFFIYAILTLLSAALVGNATHSFVFKVMEKQYSEQLQQSLTVITESVRNDLILGNTRDAIRRLRGVSKENLFTHFQIEGTDFKYQSKELAATPPSDADVQSFINTSIPVLFSKEAQSATWGNIIYSSNLEPIHRTSRNIQAIVVSSIVGVGCLALLLALGVFGWLYRASTMLATAVEEFAATLTLPDEQTAKSAIWAPLFSQLRQSAIQIADLRTQIIHARQYEAIASMTQMVAHDVRKPFSLVKSALTILNRANSIEDVRKNMGVIGPSIDKALTSVNGMLEDIMEIGRVQKPITEPTSLVAIVEASLEEVFRVHHDAQIKLRYRFEHTHSVNAEFAKVGRVVSNIVGNAVQAMNRNGEIWIESNDRGGFVEVKIGNTGPLIPEEDLAKLFEAFYSKGKKGGTGLGLAIAKKVVVAHGGHIRCAHTADKKFVEFVFTLPSCEKTDTELSRTLPTQSKEFENSIASLATNKTTPEASVVADPRESEFEARIVESSQKIGRPLVLAMLDDEPLYQAALQGLIAGAGTSLASVVQVDVYENSTSFLHALNTQKHPDFLVCDIDLSVADSMDGFEVVRTSRELGFTGSVCVHSNRSSTEDSKKGLQAGANLVLPKPMSRAHLLGFLASSTAKIEHTRGAQTQAGQSPNTKPLVAIVDDDALVLMAWEMELKGEVDCILADSVETLMQQITNNSALIERLTCVVTDFWFENENALQKNIVGKLRNQGYTGSILLSSNSDSSKGLSEFTAVIPKQALSWDALQKLVSKFD